MHPVSIKGFLAELDPGTDFEFEKVSVAPGFRMAKHVSMRSRAKVLQVIPKNGQEDDTRFNDHRAQPSSVLSAAVRIENPSSAVAGRQTFVLRNDRSIFLSFFLSLRGFRCGSGSQLLGGHRDRLGRSFSRLGFFGGFRLRLR
jgi:hypothetical protein